ncbi:MAG: hypothetical protein MUE94_05465 [Verrucomicrobia bacterium]|nr:hypothetical protein [Verrucomicrobiota bacterium]
MTTLGAILLLWTANPAPLDAAGVTLITHGNGGTTSGWVTGMANAWSARLGGNVPIYRIDVNTGTTGLVAVVTPISGGSPQTSASGEVILMLDWGPVSSGGTTTYELASIVAPLFWQTNLIAGLNGHALAEFPVHLIGHSRGGSLVCELSRKLGEHGIWVDQVTNLDTYPVDGDAPAASYESVLFSESYYQKINTFIQGDPVPGSFSRKQTEAAGGYSGILNIYNGHSDVHLWYHGTIDLNTPTDDDEVQITSTMRSTWWTAVEQAGTNAGFIYTRWGGGDRLSTNQPNGANSSPIRDGFNRYYDVGGGAGPNNRTPLLSNTGEWPNPIRFELLSTNGVEHGDTATCEIYFQWAQPNTSTQTVQVLADPDQNPLNGNEVLLEDGFATGTTIAQVGQGTIAVDFDGAVLPPGHYRLFVRMSVAGRTRLLYAPALISLSTSSQPVVLDIAPTTNSSVVLGINGVAGQTVVLERSLDGAPWLPIATNTLNSARWERVEPNDTGSTTILLRARLSSPSP